MRWLFPLQALGGPGLTASGWDSVQAGMYTQATEPPRCYVAKWDDGSSRSNTASLHNPDKGLAARWWLPMLLDAEALAVCWILGPGWWRMERKPWKRKRSERTMWKLWCKERKESIAEKLR
ncbi:unnamed protein product [Rangifer tarandus platyrhynchus]|uniref:Uncharacterized protein n=1 Tax=Rangifer tarandus platyrhynchus TaxID=3082113 RepID=A0ACB1MJG9_RANTA